MGDGLGFVILFSHLSLWMWHPCRERDGKTEIVISTQNFSYPVQQQGAPHSLIYFLSHCTVLQQEHFPSSSSHICWGWKMQAEEKTNRQPLWFCNRVASPQVNVSAWSPALLLFQKSCFIYLQLDMHQKVLQTDNKWEDLLHGKGMQGSVLQRWWLWLSSTWGCVLGNNHQQGGGEVLSQDCSQELHDAH